MWPDARWASGWTTCLEDSEGVTGPISRADISADSKPNVPPTRSLPAKF
jgi:hypothetical protein